MRVFDVFPFAGTAIELDLLEIRLHELGDVVDAFLVGESSETFAGVYKGYVGIDAMAGRFEQFFNLDELNASHLHYLQLGPLQPFCTDRTSGRLREAYQRNLLKRYLEEFGPDADDVIIFSDLDEIPDRRAVDFYIKNKLSGIYRFSQKSYYYNVNTLTDVGHDWASRARIGRYQDLLEVGNLYDFRMARKNTEEFVIPDGGWHFSYFGGVEAIQTKVATMSPFLSEYRMFGEEALRQDIADGRDLHHRRCELPETFQKVGNEGLPEYLTSSLARFSHFLAEGCLCETQG